MYILLYIYILYNILCVNCFVIVWNKITNIGFIKRLFVIFSFVLCVLVCLFHMKQYKIKKPKL